MRVDLNELICAKFSALVESMLFVVVEAISHLDNVQSEECEAETNTLEFVRDSYKDRLDKVVAIINIII